jgi:hypothetical protein
VRVHGTACFSGSLSNQWTVRDFSPNEYLPRGVRLAGYFDDAADLPREVFQEIVDAVAAGRLSFPVDRVYDGLEQVRQRTTTWNTTAPPASSSSASDTRTPLRYGSGISSPGWTGSAGR